jgi:hypothetical protein
MLNTVSRTWLLGGIWFATLALIIAWSVAVGASVSTNALLLVMGVVPPGIVVILRFSAPPPTVAELLHSVNAKDAADD